MSLITTEIHHVTKNVWGTSHAVVLQENRAGEDWRNEDVRLSTAWWYFYLPSCLIFCSCTGFSRDGRTAQLLQTQLHPSHHCQIHRTSFCSHQELEKEEEEEKETDKQEKWVKKRLIRHHSHRNYNLFRKTHVFLSSWGEINRFKIFCTSPKIAVIYYSEHTQTVILSSKYTWPHKQIFISL